MAAIEREIENFLYVVDARNRSPRTLQQYTSELRRLRLWLADDGTSQVEEITPMHLSRFLLYLRDTRRLKPNSQHAAYRSFRAFLNWYEHAHRGSGWLNPMYDVEPPRVPKKRIPAPDPETLRALIESCQGHSFIEDRDRALLMFLLDTGVRAQECLLIDVGHVDMERHKVRIVYGKGDNERFAYPDKIVVKALAWYLKHRGQVKPEAPLWTDKNGRRLSYWGLRQILARRSDRIRVEMPSPHDFRRAFATARNVDGVTSVDLQHMLGHSDLQTLWRYVDTNEPHLEEVQRRTSPVARLMRGQ